MRPRPSTDPRKSPRRLFVELAGLLAATPRTWSYWIGLAVALVALATLVRVALLGVIGTLAPFQFYYLAVTLAAVLGGYRSGAIALAGSAFAVVLFPAGPPPVIAPPGPALTVGLVIFVVSAGLEGLIAASLRRAVLQLRDRDLELSLIADELRHRVKNVLALVQSVSRQISRTAGDVGGFQLAFETRLKALAECHDILARSGWAGAGLHELIGVHLDPFVSPEGPRLRLQGEDLVLAPDTAVSLSLILHELTTNAVKYGSLSTPAGELRLSWRCDRAPDRLVLDWLERGGPQVAPPARTGFGATLIARTLAPDGRIDFDPAGLHVIATFPLDGRSPAVRSAGGRPQFPHRTGSV